MIIFIIFCSLFLISNIILITFAICREVTYKKSLKAYVNSKEEKKIDENIYITSEEMNLYDVLYGPYIQQTPQKNSGTDIRDIRSNVNHKYEPFIKLISTVVIVSLIIVMILTCLIGIYHVKSKNNIGYNKYKSEYEVLNYRLENQKDHILEDKELYNDIVNYNQIIRKEKIYCDNIWVNWYHDSSITKCDIIDLSQYGV